MMDCKRKEIYIYTVLFLLAAVIFGSMTYVKGNNLDFDEFYSIAMINHSFSNIWAITSYDVHPPLSYYILKIHKFISDHPSGHYYLYRISSIIGYGISMLISCFAVRRLWGFRASVFCLLLFILIPNSFYTYSNVRMYAWAMTFVFGAFVYSCDAYLGNKRWAWAKLMFFTLCAMYTHYYALIGVFFVYAGLFAAICMRKDGRKESIRNYIASGLILVVLYMPWMASLLAQMSSVNEQYWIKYPAISDIVFAAQYYFVPKYYTETYNIFYGNTWFLALIPLLLLLVVVISILAVKNRKSNERLINTGLAAVGFVMLLFAVVLVYTFLVSPLYHVRYMTCFLGVFVLGIALLLSVASKKNTIGAIVACLFFIFLLADMVICADINIKRNGRETLVAFQASIAKFMKDTDLAFYSEHGRAASLSFMSVAYPEYKYYLILGKDSVDSYKTDPFDRLIKINSVDTDAKFVLIADSIDTGNPKLKNFVVIDSMIGVWYKMAPKNSSISKEENP